MFTFQTTAKFDDVEKLVKRIATPSNTQRREVSDAIRAGFAANFASQGSARGAWATLAPATIRDRIRRGFGASPIRVRTGKGRSGFVERGHPDHVENVSTISQGVLYEVGSSDQTVSLFHETGTSRMPARPVTPLSDEHEQRILRVIEQSILRMARET